MIFIKIKQKIDTKKTLNKEYMFSYFNKRKQKFLPKNMKLLDINIDLVRNFRGKFRNMSLRYELITNKGKRIVRAKINKYQDVPQREWQTLVFVKKYGLGRNVSLPLDYFKPLNIFFYLETPGISFEKLLSQKKLRYHSQFITPIAQWLRRIHSIKKRPYFLPVKTIQQERLERRHWFFLVKKCGPSFYPRFSRVLKALWNFKQKNNNIFIGPKQFSLVHGDFHWGNIIRNKDQFRVIDFGYAFLGDRLEDVGAFLAQNDSMFRYYSPDFISRAQKIRHTFIKKYFGKKLNNNQQIRLLYFEIQKILQMAAILVFIEPNKEYKKRGVTKLLKITEEKLKILNSF